MTLQHAAIQRYEALYGEHPRYLIRSPGRVNLIGEHTDYNDGFVLPLAIEPAVWMAFSPTDDPAVSLYSDDFQQMQSFRLEQPGPVEPGWIGYVQGVANCLAEDRYPLAGWRGCICSDLPIGAGLSSSAALEMAAVKAFAVSAGFELSIQQMARIGQRAENEWVGMNCGIMDQLAAAGGRPGHALQIDCRTLAVKTIALPGSCRVAILDTGTRRRLVSSAYNDRRVQCEAAARYFGVSSLRDLTRATLDEAGGDLDATIRQRALHVVSENRRVLATVAVLEDGDPSAVGRLMVKSHESLRDLFEVSSPALDGMVSAALQSSGCHGARITGAGFGGCAVALIEREAADAFKTSVMRHYREKTGKEATVTITNATQGTALTCLD